MKEEKERRDGGIREEGRRENEGEDLNLGEEGEPSRC